MCSTFKKHKDSPVGSSGSLSLGETRGAGGVEKKASVLKSLVIGDMAVGKSSLSFRFTKNEFSGTPIVTHAMDYTSKPLTLSGKNVTLQVWDTAGQERFRTITSSYYRGAHAILLVYDVSKPDTWNNLKQCWYTEAERSASPGVVFCVCGNKTDTGDIVVTAEEVNSFCVSKGIDLIFFTSAKTGTNVSEMFTAIAAGILKARGDD